MHRKLICTIASVAMLAGLLFIGATPAQAAPPADTHNFLPDDTPKAGNSSVGTVLSDRFDGVDTTAHLTNVATAETDRVQWRLCAAGTVGAPGTETLTQAQFDACTIIIGEDTSATTPAGNGVSTVDEAYEFNWDIPGSEDGATRDIVAAACTGAGNDVEGADANCQVDVENDVLLEDAQTGATQTLSGEITTFCTSDVGGPGPEADPCVRGEGGTNAEVDARFSPLVHGSSVPNDGFVFRARTSEEVTLSYMIGPGDAVTDPQGPLDANAVTCTVIFTGTNFQEWECQVTDAEIGDNAERHLTLIEEFGGGTGHCAAVFCQLDSHYIVSGARVPATAVLTFQDPELSDAENCASPDDAEDNNLGEFESVLFCVTDQFGEPISTDVTFESSGVASAGFDGTEDCSALNHDGDAAGVDEHCDGSTDTDGVARAVIANPDDWEPGEAATPGDQIVTACVEGEPFAGDPAPADHGCADETLVDSVTKTWDSVANTVTLVFGDKTTSCFTGPTFRENQVGDTDNLLACVFDGFGNPTSTTGDDDGFLEWSIGTGNDDDVDTQYVGVPPSETDAEGEAVAQIEAIDPGSDSPQVCLRENTTGDFLSCDSVQKNVRPADPDPGRARSNVSIRHRTGPHRFTGHVSSPRNSCERNRTVVLKRRRPGNDPTIGRDRVNRRGNYVIRHRRTSQRRTYYARVLRNANCQADNSRNIRRR